MLTCEHVLWVVGFGRSIFFGWIDNGSCVIYVGYWKAITPAINTRDGLSGYPIGQFFYMQNEWYVVNFDHNNYYDMCV